MRAGLFASALMLLSVSLITPLAQAQDWIYPIRSGDTLWSLCLEYTNKPGCWQELGKHNGITADTKIPVNAEIRIPVAWLTNVPQVGEVIALAGEVFYDARSDGTVKAVQRGQSLALGSTISVSTGSATIRLVHDGEIILRAGSRLMLESMSTRREVKGVTELKLEAGEAEIDVAPDSNSRFEVKTPSAIAAVRGTQYRLVAQEGTRGEVIEGAVAVEAASTIVVDQGFGVLAREGEPVGEPRKLLAAPAFAESGAVASVPYTLRWSPQPGAVAWRLDVYANAQSGALIATHDTAAPEQLLDELPLGCYRLALRAIDKEGFNGMPADTTLCIEPAPPPSVEETPNYWKAFVSILGFMLIVVL
jgi:hypothetical protein